ncbi:hypothetical protein, partial [Aetokthonos hydrillicola]|uniref:hypothetical protein n=1 Tax=Aetokthonos hydrillicola TaxID=1550245 RepID=UPI001ABBDF38
LQPSELGPRVDSVACTEPTDTAIRACGSACRIGDVADTPTLSGSFTPVLVLERRNDEWTFWLLLLKTERKRKGD